MKNHVRTNITITTGFAVLILALPALAETVVSLSDPAGDDNGPGTFTYPTDSVYERGSFDLREFTIDVDGNNAVFSVKLPKKIADPWNSKSWQGNGFSLQFIQVYIDTDHKTASGYKDGLPGMNISLKDESAWEKVVLISPQPKTRLESEVSTKATAMKSGVVIPTKTRVRNSIIEATVPLSELGGKPQKGWGYLVVMQSNEGYPAGTDLMTRKVNELAGAHRFGGGSDWECDPHVIDMIVAPGKGSSDEVTAQNAVLKYSCDPDPETAPKVALPMVYP